MKKSVVIAALVAGTFMIPFSVSAQYKTKDASDKDSQTQELLAQAESSETPVVITLEQALEMFPKELYTMAIEKTGNGVLHIGLVREIYGSAQYGTLPESSGVCFLQDGEVYMMLAMKKDLPYHFCRQLNLTMQSRILSECTAYYDWDTLNPKDFRYDNDYIKNLDRTGDTYLKGDRAFIDTFSMSFATEDRATIFAYACFPGNDRRDRCRD